MVKLWSAILHLAPQSRVLLKFRGMETEALQNRYRGWFQEDGIEATRLLFAGQSPAETYLADFGLIDIALDPFPYNGGSTTLDALWMGVPVVTLAGRLAVQRDGASILSAAGLADFVAQTPEQYIKIALFLAAVIPGKPDLRSELRHALAASPLMDEAGLVRDVENAYREMSRLVRSAKRMTRAGYMHPFYAEALSEFGTPVALPASGGWLLERCLPGTADRDAMGPYPSSAARIGMHSGRIWTPCAGVWSA